jgi:hypothetical protein
VDEFAVIARNTNPNLYAVLTTAAQRLSEVPSGQVYGDVQHELYMPATGSVGAGHTMSFDIVWTASVVQ